MLLRVFCTDSPLDYIVDSILCPAGHTGVEIENKTMVHRNAEKTMVRRDAGGLRAKTAADGCKVKILFFNFRSFSIFPNCQRHPCQNSACHGHSYYEKNRFKVNLLYKLLL